MVTNASRRPLKVVSKAEVVFIVADTPQSESGSADLASVATVARGIGRTLSEVGTDRERPLVVGNKSTVPVSSGDYVSMLLREGAEEGGNGTVDYRVVSNPEFLREGSAIYDCLFPDRIVVGADSREALDTMRALYEPIIEQSFPTEVDPRPKVAVPFVTTDLVSAEMIKYAANAFLATKIGFLSQRERWREGPASWAAIRAGGSYLRACRRSGGWARLGIPRGATALSVRV